MAIRTALHPGFHSWRGGAHCHQRHWPQSEESRAARRCRRLALAGQRVMRLTLNGLRTSVRSRSFLWCQTLSADVWLVNRHYPTQHFLCTVADVFADSASTCLTASLPVRPPGFSHPVKASCAFPPSSVTVSREIQVDPRIDEH